MKTEFQKRFPTIKTIKEIHDMKYFMPEEFFDWLDKCPLHNNYIILNNKGKCEAIGKSRSTYYLSKKDSNGNSTFYYADYCMLSPCIYYRLDLDNLN